MNISGQMLQGAKQLPTIYVNIWLMPLNFECFPAKHVIRVVQDTVFSVPLFFEHSKNKVLETIIVSSTLKSWDLIT